MHSHTDAPLLDLAFNQILIGSLEAAVSKGVEVAADAAEGVAHTVGGFGALLDGFDLRSFGNSMGLGGVRTAPSVVPAVLEVTSADVGPTILAAAHALPLGVMEASHNDIAAPTFAGAAHTGQSFGIGW